MTKFGDTASAMSGMGDAPSDEFDEPNVQPKVEDMDQGERKPKQEVTQSQEAAGASAGQEEAAKDPDVLSEKERQEKLRKCFAARQGLTDVYYTPPKKRSAEPLNENNKSAKKKNYGKFNVID